jgi:hypothetical protein
MGVSNPASKKKCLFGTNPWERDMSLVGGIGALPKVLKAHMDEAKWSPKPTRGRIHDFHGHWLNMRA